MNRAVEKKFYSLAEDLLFDVEFGVGFDAACICYDPFFKKLNPIILGSTGAGVVECATNRPSVLLACVKDAVRGYEQRR